MKVLHDPSLPTKLSHKWLFLDADVIIDAQKYEPLLEFLYEVRQKEVALTTIRSVYFEFMRGADSIESFNDNANYLKKLCTIDAFEQKRPELDGLEDFIIVMSKLRDNKSYADFLLAACLYAYEGKSLLITGNNKDYSTDIFNRVDVITLDTKDKDLIKNYGIYSFSEEKYQKAAENILKNK